MKTPDHLQLRPIALALGLLLTGGLHAADLGLKNGDFRARTPAGDIPVRLQIAPLYDPQRLRILDR